MKMKAVSKQVFEVIPREEDVAKFNMKVMCEEPSD
jgi:hypothetical protein